jgi:hypothetical protein
MNVLKQVCGRANKVFWVGLLFLAVAAGVFAQADKLGRIAILPFSGGTADEGEGIAELFSGASVMMDNFRVIPRTGITRAAANEQEFQANSGMTSADTIARLGNQFGAEYVMAGSITRVGTQNLLIVSIVKIDVIRQVAGDFLRYDSLDALRDGTIIQKMADNLAKMVREQKDGLDKLALLPVDIPAEANVQEGDALAQILAIHLLRRNAYAVYPRTKTLDQVQSEYETQLSGVTRDREAVVAGRGDNPPFALSVISRRISSINVFNAIVMDLEGGSQIAGESEEYATLEDGIAAMEFLARVLSGEKVSDRERNRRAGSVAASQAAEEAARKKAENAANWDRLLKSSGFAVHFYGGGSVGGSGSVEAQDNDINTWDKNEYIEKQAGSFLFPSVELRLGKTFGIQTGIGIIEDYFEYVPASSDPAKYDKLKTVMLPVLARLNLRYVDGNLDGNLRHVDTTGFYAAVYGGVALNLSTTSDEAVSLEPALLSFIVGAGVGFDFYGLEIGLGFLYNGDIGSGTATYEGIADPLSYQRGQVAMYFHISYEIPFSKRTWR